MTALFLMTGCFMIVFFFGLVGFIIYAEKRRSVSDKESEKRFKILSDKIAETQSLFKVEVYDILRTVKDFIK